MRPMDRLAPILLMVLAAGLLSAVAAPALEVPATLDRVVTDDVTNVLCHATSSSRNPYTIVKINGPKDLPGHSRHTGPMFTPGMDSGWGDVIPAVGDYPGMNNDAFGQALINNGCVYPTEDPTGYLAPIVTCFRLDQPDNVYQVLYSYQNVTPLTLTVPHGPQNTVTPSSMAPYSPESFSPGFVLQGFAVTLDAAGTSPSDALSTWTLAGSSATFTPASTQTCGSDVVVPADGNGAGWAIAALLSIPLVGIPVVLALRRAGRPGPANHSLRAA
ncbi:MAG: hypothetical protein Q7V58_14840 [Actinomycetota bacterium]|nr:hypothetical protein [Actinomycetota bacterium]